MNKQFKFKNGYIGTLPEAVAETLEKRGEGKIVSQEKSEQPSLLPHEGKKNK